MSAIMDAIKDAMKSAKKGGTITVEAEAEPDKEALTQSIEDFFKAAQDGDFEKASEVFIKAVHIAGSCEPDADEEEEPEEDSEE